MKSAKFRIANMDCTAEESEIRRALEPIDGIEGLGFQLGARTLTIHAPAAVIPQALAAIRRVGFHPQAVDAFGPPASLAGRQHDHAEHAHAHAHADTHGVPANGTSRLLWALLLATLAELTVLGDAVASPAALRVLEGALALGAIGLAGLGTYQKGLAALRHGRLNINALMTVAVTGAFALGQWPEAAMVMALYALAELIEARSVDRARNAIQRLMTLSPSEAEVRQDDGRWVPQPTQGIAVGAQVRVRPGQRIALDGVVLGGQSSVDQSPVTGESLPVDKGPGDTVFAGTVNQAGELTLRVTALAGDTTLARIIHAVEQAQGSRAPTQRFVDRFAAVYTPAVFTLALGVALLSPWLLGWSWSAAAYKALVLLVIACPCALVIATPVTVVSALAAAARRGILIKGGTYLEDARKLKVVALDKTGTMTQGAPRLVAATPLVDPSAWPDIAAIALALAERSDHPISKAIVTGLREQGLASERPAPLAATMSDVTALVGRGVSATLSGTPYVLGNHRLIEDLGLCSAALEAQLRTHEEQGRTVAVLADGNTVLALFAVADTIRETSARAVAELQALGLHCVALSGDNDATVQTVARQAGIQDARGHLLPEDKHLAIQALQTQRGPTAMVGDGINDAPALAQADIGVAMGAAGTDTAMEAADVVIMNDDLRRLAATVRLSRLTHAVLWQNIVLALGIKAAFLVLAILGEATMWMAVFADMGASLIVVANGLRMLRAKVDG